MQTQQASQQNINQQNINQQIPKQQQHQKLILPYRHLSPLYFTLSRPQYKRSCGISSLISIFNYQFSTLGLGKLNPITIEQALLKLNVLGTGSISQQFKNLKQNYKNLNKQESDEQQKPKISIENNKKGLNDYINQLDLGYFTYSNTLLKWYRLLCRLYNVKGKCNYFYKTSGPQKTTITQNDAKHSLIEKIYKGKSCFIYHAHDHYFCPLGYQIVKKKRNNSFQNSNCADIFDDSDIWILIGQTAKTYAPLLVVKWQEIQLDLTTYWPQIYDIRKREKGVTFVKGKQNEKPDGTYNCILQFEKLRD